MAKEIVQRGDPMWGYYRGLDGKQTPHELRPTEMANLFGRFFIHWKTVWPKGPRQPKGSAPGYFSLQFEKAHILTIPQDHPVTKVLIIHTCITGDRTCRTSAGRSSSRSWAPC
jgi:hypothetical protein